jgi:hypothetical protein
MASAAMDAVGTVGKGAAAVAQRTTNAMSAFGEGGGSSHSGRLTDGLDGTAAAAAPGAGSPRPSSGPRGPQLPFGLKELSKTSLTKVGEGASARSDDGGRVRHNGLPPVKLLDFGVSQVCVDALDASKTPKKEKKKRFDDSILKATGTPAFYSPEMCVGKPFHGRPADVWAAGVTLCMLVSGELPFPSDNMPDMWRKIKEEPPTLPPSLSAPLREILTEMLQKNPNKRPTVAALRQHTWVTNGGTDPMPEQKHLPLEISDDDIMQAVKQMANTFALVTAGKKWKLNARQRSERQKSEASEREAKEAGASASEPSDKPTEGVAAAAAPPAAGGGGKQSGTGMKKLRVLGKLAKGQKQAAAQGELATDGGGKPATLKRLGSSGGKRGSIFGGARRAMSIGSSKERRTSGSSPSSPSGGPTMTRGDSMNMNDKI